MSVELPPLPLTKSEYGFDDTPAFTADQMYAYARAAVNAALERAAHECELLRYEPIDQPCEYDDACNDCAAAIRKLKTKE